MDSAAAGRSARHWLAAVLEADPEELLLVSIDPIEEGFRVRLSGRHGEFVVELAVRRELYRLQRLGPPDPDPPR
jgi:hypothetical protein